MRKLAFETAVTGSPFVATESACDKGKAQMTPESGLTKPRQTARFADGSKGSDTEQVLPPTLEVLLLEKEPLVAVGIDATHPMMCCLARMRRRLRALSCFKDTSGGSRSPTAHQTAQTQLQRDLRFLCKS